MAKRKVDKSLVDFYMEGDVPDVSQRPPTTILHVVHVLPSANVPHNRVYIDCKPQDWPSRKAALTRRHPDWFSERQPSTFRGARLPV